MGSLCIHVSVLHVKESCKSLASLPGLTDLAGNMAGGSVTIVSEEPPASILKNTSVLKRHSALYIETFGIHLQKHQAAVTGLVLPSGI
jgi:hypothetical protein